MTANPYRPKKKGKKKVVRKKDEYQESIDEDERMLQKYGDMI